MKDKTNIKQLSSLIGLSSYQAIQRKLKGTDLLVGRMHVKDAGRFSLKNRNNPLTGVVWELWRAPTDDDCRN